MNIYNPPTSSPGMTITGNSSITGRLLLSGTVGNEVLSATGFGGGKLVIDASGGNFNQYYADTQRFYNAAGTQIAEMTVGAFDVVGLSRCDSFRIDATPSAAVISSTHKLAINCNGATYYMLLSNV
jgi:hypothetical protein